MTIITRQVLPQEEHLKANLYNTLVKLGLSRGFYMNWNYAPVYTLGKTEPIAWDLIVGDTRWNQ